MTRSTPPRRTAPRRVASRRVALATALLAAFGSAHTAITLTGLAVLDANTFAPGPTSGQFQAPAIGIAPPYVDKQPVQGFSAVVAGPTAGSYYVMPDNGFGTEGNSADALLRVYAVNPDFRTATGGSWLVRAVDFASRAVQTTFNTSTFITLRDPDKKLGPDNTEFIRIRLDTPLNMAAVPEPQTYALMLAGSR